MLKTAIYGLLRVTLRPAPRPALVVGRRSRWCSGSLTALFGVIFATVQTDMKRLLAYSSIENIGIIVAGIGLTILFKAYGKTLLAAIALTATLYHALNHAFFKSLLFLATGSVLHATRERSLGKLGGLIHRMPWVAWLGAGRRRSRSPGCRRSTASSPNGCCCRRSCSRRACRNRSSTCWCRSRRRRWCWPPRSRAYVMVKFYGVVFLGRPREPNLAYAHDAGRFERVALVWFAAGCVALGLFPVHRHRAARHGQHDADRLDGRAGRRATGWLLAPINAGPRRATAR